MNQLRIVADCSSMLISTQFFRFCKAVEHFYYALLFSSEDYAASAADAWHSWAAQGFHLAVREFPPAARPGDRLTLDSRPGRTFEVTASSNNRGALTRLCELVQEVEHARAALPSGGEEVRLQALLDNPAIESRLLRPVRESLTRSAVAGEAGQAVRSMISRGLSALTNWQIKSLRAAVE
jgi:hypothetical protein